MDSAVSDTYDGIMMNTHTLLRFVNFTISQIYSYTHRKIYWVSVSCSQVMHGWQ